MKDTPEANLPEVEGQLEETKAPVEQVEIGTVNAEAEKMPEETPVVLETSEALSEEKAAANPDDPEGETVAGTDTPADDDLVNTSKLSKKEIVDRLTHLVETSAEGVKGEVESLKQAYYKIRHHELDELKDNFIATGGEEEAFVAPEDETENILKELLAVHKEKKAAAYAELERVKQANYALKLQLIDQLKTLTESQDDFNKLYNEFKDIQIRWKEVKPVPQEFANELWKNYQTYTEKFYDIIKINNQFRDYDFKKNLELKNILCETVEKLQEETDIISAFHQLQKLHQQWREIGPVAKDVREEVWGRFKAASTVINRKHQDHFEKLKSREQDNLDAKTAICEEIEAIDYEALKSVRDWDVKNREVIALQDKWKTIGFAPKKFNVKIFERFRAACDIFFQKKSEFYKNAKVGMEANLDLKKALCEKAEALKDSTEWKETTDKMIALQKEWKKIGPVARKHSDAIWKRFIAACDFFFEQKNKNTSSQKSVEQTNLTAKRVLIDKIKALETVADAEEAMSSLKEFMAEWGSIGFVPFKEKDKIYKEYHEVVDKLYDRLKVDKNDRKMQSFRSNLSDITHGEHGKGRLYSEREKLMRAYERMKGELQTYENNIGFLSVSSKGGGGLVKEMERKIEKLKEDMALIIQKIDAIDENIE